MCCGVAAADRKRGCRYSLFIGLSAKIATFRLISKFFGVKKNMRLASK